MRYNQLYKDMYYCGQLVATGHVDFDNFEKNIHF